MLKRVLYALSASALMLALPVRAADVTRTDLSRNSAEASFSSFHGCEDVVVGVSVTEESLKGSEEASSEVAVFGSIVDVCEFGTSSFFYGTAPLAPGEYAQDGVEGATLVKTMAVDGYEIQLSLAWDGNGEVVVERSKIKEDGDAVRARGHEETTTRSADASGSFVVNGLDRIDGGSIANAGLGLYRRAATDIEFTP